MLTKFDSSYEFWSQRFHPGAIGGWMLSIHGDTASVHFKKGINKFVAQIHAGGNRAQHVKAIGLDLVVRYADLQAGEIVDRVYLGGGQGVGMGVRVWVWCIVVNFFSLFLQSRDPVPTSPGPGT